MKKIAFFSCLFLISASTIQKHELPTDESGKYVLIEVAEFPGIKKEDLFNAGKAFIQKIKIANQRKKHLVADTEKMILINKGSFFVHKPGSLQKHADGAVLYDIRLEFKDDKYRCIVTNFQFKEYRRNRYGKYEPVKGKIIPLETQPSGLNRKTWDNYKKIVLTKSTDLIENLKQEMSGKIMAKQENVTINEKW